MMSFFKNGRFAAIFFLSLLSLNVGAIEGAIYWTQESAINRGLLDERYWRDSTWQMNSPKVLTYLDTRIGTSATIGAHTLFLERRQIATLATNSNSLAAAAQGSSVLSNLANGTYALNAKLKKFRFDAIGLTLNNPVSEELRVSLSPKIVRLNDFSIGDGQGQLTQGVNSQQLSGLVDRQGTSAFGYLYNQAPTQLGTGGTLDAQATWRRRGFLLSTEVTNWLSRIPSTGINLSQLDYQVNVQNGSLVFNDVPSLHGTYGQRDTTLRLPTVWKTHIAHQGEGSNWSQHAGAITLDGGHIPWIGLGYSRGDSAWMIRSYQLNNLFIRYEMKNFLVNHLNFEITLGLADHHKHQHALTAVRYEF